MKRWQFYLLSFTWGLPMSLLGLIVFVALLCFGKRPRRFGHAYYMSIGRKPWGGLEFGWFFLVDGADNEFIKRHELGHGYQNCVYGPIYPILWFIAIVRYWLKRWGAKFDYYGWWLEKEANKIGMEVMRNDTR